MQTMRLAASIFAISIALPSVSCSAQNQAIPFVGCPGDGQVGPIEAPTGDPRALSVDVNVANQLAYYSTGSLGVYAPRGWNCFYWYGSAGTTLFVAPGNVRGVSFPIEGPAMVVDVSIGGTSGRFGVARFAATFFPTRIVEFVDRIRREDLELTPETPLEAGPFPDDSVTYTSPTTMELRTPPGREGLCTEDYFKKSSAPIVGALHLDDTVPSEPDLYILCISMPEESDNLSKQIIKLSWSPNNALQPTAASGGG